MTSYQFSHAAVAGTFDRLHHGHASLLKKAFSLAKKVSIGITAKSMVQKKELKELIEPYAKRKKVLIAFLKAKQYMQRASIFSLHDIYGPAIYDPTIEALIVSKKTIVGAKEVNRKRKQLGKPPLPVIVADYITSEDRSYLSSTRIRKGEIDRQGNSYELFLLRYAPFILNKKARIILKKPLGKLLASAKEAKPYIAKAPYAYAVGDVVTHDFLVNNITVDLAVFDFKTKREPTSLMNSVKIFQRAKNNPGQINRDAIRKLLSIQQEIAKGRRKQINLLVKGEEDLLVLPIILCAPLESLVFYGQPNKGIVIVRVTEEMKHHVLDLLSN